MQHSTLSRYSSATTQQPKPGVSATTTTTQQQQHTVQLQQVKKEPRTTAVLPISSANRKYKSQQRSTILLDLTKED